MMTETPLTADLYTEIKAVERFEYSRMNIGFIAQAWLQ